MSRETASSPLPCLASPTDGEVEFIEFAVHGQAFGVNIAKVREITRFIAADCTPLPQTPEAVRGQLLLRDHRVSLIDVEAVLFGSVMLDDERSVVIVVECNACTAGFLVSEARRIYRRRWSDLEAVESDFSDCQVDLIGSLRVDDHDLLILDFESIIGRLLPRSQLDRLSHGPDDTERHQARGSKRILVADDSRFIRMQLQEGLERHGYCDCHVCADGTVALAAYEEQAGHFDIVLTDIEMPGLDGLSLCKRLNNQVPVIILSSLINPSMIEHCQEAGAAAWLRKSDSTDLIATLDRLLGIGAAS